MNKLIGAKNKVVQSAAMSSNKMGKPLSKMVRKKDDGASSIMKMMQNSTLGSKDSNLMKLMSGSGRSLKGAKPSTGKRLGKFNSRLSPMLGAKSMQNDEKSGGGFMRGMLSKLGGLFSGFGGFGRGHKQNKPHRSPGRGRKGEKGRSGGFMGGMLSKLGGLFSGFGGFGRGHK